MASRLELHAKLLSLMEGNKVYFQPPESVKLKYPCIVYSRKSGDTKYADDNPYNYIQDYQLTIIDNDPDSRFVRKLALAFPMIRHANFFIKDNLNHDVYILFY